MAWAVTILLYNWLLDMNWTPGPLSSNLIITEKAVPDNPENKANIKYKVPISLALVELNHLSIAIDISDLKLKARLSSFSCSSSSSSCLVLKILNLWGVHLIECYYQFN